MTRLSTFVALIGFSPIMACVSADPQDSVGEEEASAIGSRDCIQVSIFELVENPSLYNERRVRVTGLIALGPEGPGYLFPDTIGRKDESNRITVHVSEELRSRREEFAGKRVSLCGWFDIIINDTGDTIYRGLSVSEIELVSGSK